MKHKSTSFLSLLFLIFINSNLYAFTLSNSGRVHFPGPKIGIIIAANTCSTAGFNSAAELESMVRESVDMYWNKIPTCALELEVEGVTTIDTSSMTLLQALQATASGKILVGCSDNADLFDAAGILGVGSINTANGDRGGLLLNNRDSSFANLEKSEKYATIAHELGHAFGLGHTEDMSALMYYAVGGKVQENLSIDDYDGCSYLYPHESPVGCGSVAYISKDDFHGPGSGGMKIIKNASRQKGAGSPSSNKLVLMTIVGSLLATLLLGKVARNS